MSARLEIEKHMEQNKDSWIASGELTRMVFKNDDKTTAAPRSISNHLQALQRESILFVRYVGKKHHSEYHFIPKERRKDYIPTNTYGVNGAWKGTKSEQDQLLALNKKSVASFDRELAADKKAKEKGKKDEPRKPKFRYEPTGDGGMREIPLI